MNALHFKGTNIFKTGAALTLCLALTACGGRANSSSAETSGSSVSSSEAVTQTALTEPQDSAVPQEVTAWLAYWAQQTYPAEVEVLGDSLTSIVHFAAYFDENAQLFVPEETAEAFQELKTQRPDCTHYLSFVNDLLKEADGSSLKDTALLEKLFADDTSMEKHVQEVLSIAQGGGYDGIEIDYENIKKNLPLWQKFTAFVGELYEKAEPAGLKLRVVLEPNVPLSQLAFPNGPEYVMMCYNLYGSHGTPGPKADKAFLQELVQSMQVLPEKKSFALATGGFDWAYKGEVTQLTEQEAQSLTERATTRTERDSASGALNFNYTDEAGTLHEVWYADGETLRIWEDTLREAGGNGISLWRLGGNDPESLKKAFGLS